MKPNKIKSLLMAKGIPQAEIADSLGVTRASVCGTISGKWTSRRVSEEIARRLKLPVEKLFPKLAA